MAYILDNEIFDESLRAVELIFPLHRSISGDGINSAFSILADEIGGNIYNYSTDSMVFDWRIPDEWVCNDISISKINEDGSVGEKIVSFDHPLRIASHSKFFKGQLSGAELKHHLVFSKKYPHNLSHQYIYYTENWKISVTKSEFELIEDNKNYFVLVDTLKYRGSLKVHEKIIGNPKKPSILFLSHICHPAQFNDGLVGVLLNIYLSKYLEKSQINNRYCYKFLTFPETIGSHAYCSNSENIRDSKFAIFSEMTALNQPLHIQMSKDENDYVNKIIRLAAKENKFDARYSPFLKVIRNDEKVFNSPGIGIPSASITRAWGPGHKNHPFWGYHTDLDTIENSDLSKLEEVIVLYKSLIDILENDFVVKMNFVGIPMLSRHDLFIDPLVDRDSYNLLEQITFQLDSEILISEIAINLNSSFYKIKSILDSWNKKGLVSLK